MVVSTLHNGLKIVWKRCILGRENFDTIGQQPACLYILARLLIFCTSRMSPNSRYDYYYIINYYLIYLNLYITIKSFRKTKSFLLYHHTANQSIYQKLLVVLMTSLIAMEKLY